jgi:hypothetical protein
MAYLFGGDLFKVSILKGEIEKKAPKTRQFKDLKKRFVVESKLKTEYLAKYNEEKNLVSQLQEVRRRNENQIDAQQEKINSYEDRLKLTKSFLQANSKYKVDPDVTKADGPEYYVPLLRQAQKLFTEFGGKGKLEKERGKVEGNIQFSVRQKPNTVFSANEVPKFRKNQLF